MAVATQHNASKESRDLENLLTFTLHCVLIILLAFDFGLVDVPRLIVKGIFYSKCGEAGGPRECAVSGKQEQKIRVALSTIRRVEIGKPPGAISECSHSFFVICSRWIAYQGG